MCALTSRFKVCRKQRAHVATRSGRCRCALLPKTLPNHAQPAFGARHIPLMLSYADLIDLLQYVYADHCVCQTTQAEAARSA